MKLKLSLLAIILSVVAMAQVPAPLPNTYINDLSGVLDKAQLYKLNDSILSIDKRTSVQIAVLIIPELPANMEIEDYARQVGNRWGVGHAKNGIVYVASLKEHKQRLEVAQNLEGDIPDVVALHITDDMKPFLRAQDYGGAIGELLKQINERVDPVAKEQLKLAAIEADKKDAKIKAQLLTVLGWIAGLGLIGWGVYYFIFYPGIKRRRKEEEDARLLQEEREHKERTERWAKEAKERQAWLLTAAGIAWTAEQSSKKEKEALDRKNNPEKYESSSYSSRSSSSSSSSSSNDSGGFGNWGGGGSSGGGFSGGGASNNW